LQLPEPWTQLRTEILTEIKPTNGEQGELAASVSRLKNGLLKALAKAGIDSEVEIHGSVARDTWLRGQRDIDVFIILKPEATRSDLLRVNEAVKGYVGPGWVEAYAEHPYVKKMVDGLEIEFVPCFKTEEGKRIASAADRTPLHTGYILDHLTESQRDEVRLLKKFTKGIGVYGAEIKVGGFSGYLCELLVIAYGSFERLIGAAREWGEHEVIQLKETAKPKKFNEPITVIDPVDPNRNVASAVTQTALWTFVAAARAFAEKPERKFFKPETRDTPVDLTKRLADRSADTLFVHVSDYDPPVPDTLWGQLYRTEKALGRALGERGFKVFRSATWSDEEKQHIFIYEIESMVLPPAVKKIGPPVRLLKDSKDFLDTYLDTPNVVSGPGIEGEKWWVEVKRRNILPQVYLKDTLVNGCEDLGVPKRLAEKLRKQGSVMINEEIEAKLTKEFALFLEGFLKGRPDWLG
jgi:tRNA nucleotidyltransferase (CCA-adding enzyme)